MGIFQSAASFREMQRPEFALRHFVRFLCAKVAVGHGMELMLAVFNICGGIIGTVVGGMGGAVSEVSALPGEIVTAIEDVTILQSIPLWLVSVLGSLIITVLSFILILTVYGRFFRLYLYTALAPIPLAAFAGEGTSAAGKAFLKSYTGVCMEGAVIVLSCLIYSAFLSSSTPAADTTLPAVSFQLSVFGKTSWERLHQMTGWILEPCSERSRTPRFQCLLLEAGQVPEWCEGDVLISPGGLWMPAIGQAPDDWRGGSEFSSWPILEGGVLTKYCLSPAQCSHFLALAQRAGCPPPKEIEALLLKQGGVYPSSSPFNSTGCGEQPSMGSTRSSAAALDGQQTLFPLY